MRVLVTGASASLARAVLPRLCAEPSIERVTGVDLRQSFFTHPKFRALQSDFRGEETVALLPEHDALLHMAYVVLRGRMNAATMREINVGSSLHLLQAAQAAGLRRIVHLSSAAVYGGGTELAESTPFAPLPGFLYGQHKAELEREIERALPQCVRLRPHIILGPHAQPVLRQILALPAYLRIVGPQPELQCVHEDDVAAAVVASLLREVAGPFNLAAPGRWTLRDVMRARHVRCLPLPPAAAQAALSVAHGVFGWGGEPGWLAGLQRTLTLDCRRAEEQLGWHPARDAAQTLADT